MTISLRHKEGRVMLPSSPSERQIHMAHWQIDLTVIQDGTDVYFSVRELCGIFGIIHVSQMLQRMREDEILMSLMKKHSMTTRGGRQQTWCIHKRAVGYWLGTIPVNKIRPEFQPKIRDLKLQALDLMDRLLWGEVDSNHAVAQIAAEHDATRALVLHLEDRIGTLESQIRIEPPESETE